MGVGDVVTKMVVGALLLLCVVVGLLLVGAGIGYSMRTCACTCGPCAPPAYTLHRWQSSGVLCADTEAVLIITQGTVTRVDGPCPTGRD
jgi:hypothetical protein